MERGKNLLRKWEQKMERGKPVKRGDFEGVKVETFNLIGSCKQIATGK